MTRFYTSLLLFLAWCTCAVASTFTVLTTADTGPGSLHAAIQAAEDHAGPDTVVFAIPESDAGFDAGKGAWRINIITALPAFLDGGTFVDGNSQTRFGGNKNAQGPEIWLFGQNAPFETPGFTIRSPYNRFTDLTIGAFPGYHFRIIGADAHHNVIQGCYLGLDPTGRFSYKIVKSEGIRLDQEAHHNVIGGPAAYERNLISGMYGRAIYLDKSHYNIIQGNYIGVKKNGLDPAGNGWTNVWQAYPTEHRPDALEGVFITNSSRGNLIGGLESGCGNVIAANLRAGVRLEATGSDSNRIIGNYIGVAADGETAMANGEAGLWIANISTGRGPAYNIIEGNVISGNFSSGIQMRWGGHHNTVCRNLIGLNADGSRALPNSHNGIYFFGRPDKGYPQYNEVGPDNVILADGEDSANDPWAAVRIDDPESSYNQIFSNYLGRNADGTVVSTHNSGVYMSKGAHHNTVGPNNTISGNRYGVWIRHDSTVCNTITANRIAGMEEAAIFLQDEANSNIPAPEIVSASPTLVSGRTIANGIVELFSGPPGETDQFLAQVDADTAGNFTWQGMMGESWVTATVRDSAGNSSMLAQGKSTPVELALFQLLRLPGGQVKLVWATATEQNNLCFYVRRSVDSTAFVTIAVVAGHGTSTEPHDYGAVDTPQGGHTIRYQLLQQDLDGRMRLLAEADVAAQQPSQFVLHPAFPNPFNQRTTLSFELPSQQFCRLRVYNEIGQCCATLLDREVAAGSHQLWWDARAADGTPLPSGVYWVLLSAGDRQERTQLLLLR